mgnify:CR=1 FL=1
MTLLLRNQQGRAITIEVDEIIAIDGQPYRASPSPLDVEATLQTLDGRMAAIEGILGLKLQLLTETTEV